MAVLPISRSAVEAAMKRVHGAVWPVQSGEVALDGERGAQMPCGSVALRNLDDVDTLLAVVITYFNTTGSVSVELNFLIATEPQFTSASNWCQMTVPGRSSSRMNARVFFRCFPIFAA
jgi:hypothetical protein